MATTTETDILTVTTTTASPGFTSSVDGGGTETITTSLQPGTQPPSSSSFTTLTSALSSSLTSSISISGPPNTNSTEILTSTTTANGTSTSDGTLITSPVVTPKPPSSGSSFSGGAVAGVVIGAIAIVALAILADQLIFSKEQRLWIRQAARGDRPTRRAAVCRQLEAKDTFAAAVDFLYSHLERETQFYVPPNNIKNENRQASLMAIARSAALVILRLGLQRDHFKLGFLFQSGNYAQVEGVIPYETSAIREFKTNPEDYQIFGEARHDSVASATISPSVYRRTGGEHKYRVRRMKIYMAPRNLRQ
ncbi:hypothetical protein TWF106_010444 [Orbilia oligospora]|uniref:Uncharacterized protein n=1 Tax=Orbilia oligospora TaxID=2813651 RepID=A0A7C8QIS4_ORBOL|nr:hypothetical protein TWF106_010444 [Orbilia oligospora]